MHTEKSRPHIILSAAMTLDGKIASKTGDSKLSSTLDKIRVHKLRAKVDAILVGINTVKHDDPILTVRYVKGKNPIRIILDSNATIKSRSRIIRTSHKTPTILVISKKASKKNLIRLQNFPLQIIECGSNKINIKKLLKILYKLQIKKILLEGGGTINWEFVKNRLIDETFITISPYLLGGKESISLVEGEGFPLISKSLKLKLQQILRLKNEVVLHYTT